MRRPNDAPIRIGGINDPVAQSIRNEHNADAVDAAKFERDRRRKLLEQLAELADDGVFLKDRDAVQAAANERDWSRVASVSQSASDSKWGRLIAGALNHRSDG